VCAAFREPREDHPWQQVAKRETTEREHQVRLGQHRRRKQKKERQGEHDPDAEEHRQRFVAPVAGLHKPQPQGAHFLGRARRFLTDALHEANQSLEARLLHRLVRLGAGQQLFEPAIDDRRTVGHQRKRRRRDDERSEHECQKRQEHRHTTPRS
jgi:hypothetical protein